MWEILLGYALEKVFGAQTTAFEIGGEYVQTSVPVDDPSPIFSKASLGFGNTNTPFGVDTKDSTSQPDKRVRQRVQVGFNPFTPIIIIGAEELYKRIAPASERDVYD